MLRSKMFILAIAVLLSMPTFALAGWGNKGDWEPNSSLDSTFMWSGPDQSASSGRHVYFNAWGGTNTYQGPTTSFNPNVGAANSRVWAWPYQVYAALGVWKDCNKDSYVGLGEQGLYYYRSELLTDASVCPATPLPAIIPKNFVIPHNDGTWVREFIPLGWDEGALTPTSQDFNPLDINDTGARVWGDWGLPGTPNAGQCFVRPEPRGTFQSVGGFDSWADCFAANKIGQTIVAAGLTSEYATLNAIGNPWGKETDGSYVQAWDCNQPTTPVSIPGQPGVKTVNTSAPNLSPGAPNLGGSPSGTMNSTGSGVDQCNRSTHNDGQTHYGTTLALLPYEAGCNAAPPCEGDVADQPNQRTQSDQTLFYNEASYPAAPIGVLPAPNKWTPADAGVRATGSDGFWVGNSVTAASRNPYLSRGSLGFEGVTHTTYYAYVSAGAVSAYGLILPPGGTGLYGAEACHGAVTGIVNGWECNTNNWWKDLSGRDVAPQATISNAPTDIGARPGSPFNLRDVDCYDDSTSATRDLGVTYGMLTGTECV